MTSIPTNQAKNKFSEIVNRACYSDERIVLSRHGKDVAAIVSLKDLKLLEEMEDRFDVLEAEKVLLDMKRNNETTISFEDWKADLGI